MVFDQVDQDLVLSFAVQPRHTLSQRMDLGVIEKLKYVCQLILLRQSRSGTPLQFVRYWDLPRRQAHILGTAR
jgi:hypothetical protein